MMRSFFVLLTCITAGIGCEDAKAQTDAAPSISTISPSDRYEIVQSEIAAKWTFRLDRFCGSVMQLVTTKDGDDAWRPMEVDAQPKCQADGKSHYELFTSGLAAKHTFLMNTTIGTTWLLVTDQNGISSWELFAR